jgi:putative tricarboxylic transport membrane protein
MMEDSRLMRRVPRDVAIGMVLVGLGTAIVALALRIPAGVETDPLGPRVFPVAMGLAIAVCGLLSALAAMLPSRWGLPAPILAESAGDDQAGLTQAMPGRLGAAVLLTAGYIAAFEPVGYVAATPVYVASLILLHGGRGRVVLVAPILLTLALYAAFRFGLLIPVPDGLLERWLS